MSSHQDYDDSYWKWKDADEANKNDQTAIAKQNENINADIPDVIIKLKEVKSQNEEVKNEMKRQNEELKSEIQEVKKLKQMMMQCLREFSKQQFFSKITSAFNAQIREVNIVFPEPVEARYITF